MAVDYSKQDAIGTLGEVDDLAPRRVRGGGGVKELSIALTTLETRKLEIAHLRWEVI